MPPKPGHDRLLYGASYEWADGTRIDPETVLTPEAAMQPDSLPSTSKRVELADQLTHLIGRYHDEDSVDSRYAKAARLLREADQQILELQQRHDPQVLFEALKDAANFDPGTERHWLPLTTVAAVLGIEGEYHKRERSDAA